MSVRRELLGDVKTDGATPESGVKKDDVVGLNGPGEKDEAAASVKALLSDVVLCE